MCLFNFLFVGIWIISTFCLLQTMRLFWIKLYSSPPSTNSHIEALTTSVAIFEDRGFKDVIKVKWGHKDGSLIQ